MKQNLKAEILEKRNNLGKEEITEKSRKIKENLFSLEEFQKARNIMFYVSFNSEVDTHEIIKEVLNEKNVIVPYVAENDPILHLSKLKSFDLLEPKKYGILEPKDMEIEDFDPEKLDLIIVPGIVFDKEGHRIGYGYGYYDKFLKKIKNNAVKIGLAFEIQIVDDIPEKEHDVPVDVVVSEKGVLKIK